MSIACSLLSVPAIDSVQALARGLIDKGVVSAEQICCSCPGAARKERFSSFGATSYESNVEVGGSLHTTFATMRVPHYAAWCMDRLKPPSAHVDGINVGLMLTPNPTLLPRPLWATNVPRSRSIVTCYLWR